MRTSNGVKCIHVIVNNNAKGLQYKFLQYLKLIKDTLKYESISEAYIKGFKPNCV